MLTAEQYRIKRLKKEQKRKLVRKMVKRVGYRVWAQIRGPIKLGMLEFEQKQKETQNEAKS